MTTSRTRALVSLAAATMLAAAVGACAGAPVRPTLAEPGHHVIRFDNDGREHVHVYLVGGRHEWLLGRVEPGERATLPIPAAALTELEGLMKLAVIAGGRVTLAAARDPRARLTIAQPASNLLSHQWRFGQGQLTSLPLPVRLRSADDVEGNPRSRDKARFELARHGFVEVLRPTVAEIQPCEVPYQTLIDL